MSNRREFLTAATVIGAAGADLLLPGAAQAQAPMPPVDTEAPPVPGQRRGSPPGPWQVPGPQPDPANWKDFKPTPASPEIKHVEFTLSPDADPIQLFVEWFKGARAAGEANVEAMTLSTVDAAGMPDSRMMLLHWINDGRFQFSSYATSAKGKQLRSNPKAALLFFWKKTGQVVRVRGTVRPLTQAQNEELRTIKRGSMDARLHDWAWHQSEIFQTAEQLEAKLREAQARFTDDVPLRDWTGWFLTPLSIEFFRPTNAAVNAERLRFSRRNNTAPWKGERLVP